MFTHDRLCLKFKFYVQFKRVQMSNATRERKSLIENREAWEYVCWLLRKATSRNLYCFIISRSCWQTHNHICQFSSSSFALSWRHEIYWIKIQGFFRRANRVFALFGYFYDCNVFCSLIRFSLISMKNCFDKQQLSSVDKWIRDDECKIRPWMLLNDFCWRIPADKDLQTSSN